MRKRELIEGLLLAVVTFCATVTVLGFIAILFAQEPLGQPGQPALGGIGNIDHRAEGSGTLQPLAIAPISTASSLNNGTVSEYGTPLILMLLLQIFFKAMGPSVGDRWKSLLALVVGAGFGLLCLTYDGGTWTAKHIIDYILQGVLSGAAATGLYEVQRSVVRPRG